MTKYREILRLTALGLSQRNIVQSIGVSQKTVVKVQKRAREMHLSWPLDETLTDAALKTLKGIQTKTDAGFQLHPEGVAPQRCQQETPLDGVPGGMPPVRRRATHVFPVLLLHPAG